MHFRHRSGCALAVVLTMAACILSATEPEDDLKAATVLSFLRYTEWPPASDGVLTVGFLGRPALLHSLQQTLEGKSVNNRGIKVVELKPPLPAYCCDLLYLATDKPAEIRQGFSLAHPPQALTIGESQQFLKMGGAINLMIVDGHMSFEVSREALDRSGLTVSSKLLRFGQIRTQAKGDAPQ